MVPTRYGVAHHRVGSLAAKNTDGLSHIQTSRENNLLDNNISLCLVFVWKSPRGTAAKLLCQRNYSPSNASQLC